MLKVIKMLTILCCIKCGKATSHIKVEIYIPERGLTIGYYCIYHDDPALDE